MSTVLELTPAERAHYIAVARMRTASLQQRDDESRRHERDKILEHLRLAAAELKSRFGVRRVILFGSLAHGAWFTEDSDVDLAVDGLEQDSYWEAWQVIEKYIGDRPVDLVELETARPALRQSIETDGMEL
ncbi:MAG TPA: nucleotidyltransferase domain-containing protein [Anaerolineae bacterium]|jgi:predicted nucleotidyltransferase